MKRFTVTCLAFAVCITALADEGMWMVNAINRALETRMQEKGLQLSAGEIYNADAPGSSLCDAVVSLDFGCTGSIISSEGLLITNHHCAYSDIFGMSTSEHNYLEDGYWAFRRDEEVPVEGKKVQFLKRVVNVTGEVLDLTDSLKRAGKPCGSRRISYLMEKKYQEETGLMASLASMWAGSEYYMALYEEYSDVRLVGAPPVSIAAYGGDIDNWEWPQHKCDFALYRVYTAPDGSPAGYSPENVPLRSENHLKISLEGYSDGDFTMIIGYPGRTDRYASGSKVEYLTKVLLPINTEVRSAQMKIISDWMRKDPSVRLKYADQYFMLSNVQELQEGELQCIERFGVQEQMNRRDEDLNNWVNDVGGRIAQFGELKSFLPWNYYRVRDNARSTIYFRETLIRGTKVSLAATRLRTALSPKNFSESRLEAVREQNAALYASLDMRVEKDLFLYSVKTFYSKVDSSYWGGYQKQLHREFGGDAAAIGEALWVNRPLTENDRIYKFLSDLTVNKFNDERSAMLKDRPLAVLDKHYTQALYQMKLDSVDVQYPDANSTMRITYGTVGGFEQTEGVMCPYYTTPQGILEKFNPDDYDFNLNQDWKTLLETKAPDIPVNFITDNDITGGNSGSPVLNSNGEIIGLAFDGNKESLAGDVFFTEGYNKTVCVDIRFVIWTLRDYAHMDSVLKEINL